MQSKAALSVVSSRLCVHIEAQKLYQCKQFGALLMSLEHSVSNSFRWGKLCKHSTNENALASHRSSPGPESPRSIKKNTIPPRQECWSRKTILEQNLDPGSRGGKAASSWKGSWFWGKVDAEGKCLKWISCHPQVADSRQFFIFIAQFAHINIYQSFLSHLVDTHGITSGSLRFYYRFTHKQAQ